MILCYNALGDNLIIFTARFGGVLYHFDTRYATARGRGERPFTPTELQFS